MLNFAKFVWLFSLIILYFTNAIFCDHDSVSSRKSGCRIPAVDLSTILPAAYIDYSSLTVSGLSSGAIMSMQYHFAHSTEVKGAGMFAGIPYGIFYNSTLGISAGAFLRSITGPVPLVPIPLVVPSNEVLERQADSFADEDMIDPIANLEGSKVYVFHGTADPIVNVVYGRKIAEIYRYFGADVKAKLNMTASHTMPTDNYPTSANDCSLPPYSSYGISNCNYQGVFKMFEHFYGEKYIPPESSTVPHTGKFSTFYQDGETAGGKSAKDDFMDKQGFLYVPRFCQDPENTCKIHIALHGCTQNIYSNLICNLFALKTGYLQAADANDVVIVFPQALPVENILKWKSNMGCWDFFGGTSKHFCHKSGPHITSIRRISRIVAKLED